MLPQPLLSTTYLSTHRQKRPYVHVLNLFLAMGSIFPAALEKQFGQQYGHQTLTHHFHFICFVPAKNWIQTCKSLVTPAVCPDDAAAFDDCRLTALSDRRTTALSNTLSPGSHAGFL